MSRILECCVYPLRGGCMQSGVGYLALEESKKAFPKSII